MNVKPKVLIVDDRVKNIIVLEEMLADLDIELVRATSGLEAIEKANKTEFALVLMDVRMPGMDGFETVEKIRKDPLNELIPIIYITAFYNEDYYRVKGIKTGAVDFITKPIIPDILIGKVTVFMKIYKQRKNLEEEIVWREQIEKDLKKAKNLAEDATRAKQKFLSTMSHEIRTPLNAIINTVNLLREEEPRADQMESIDILKFSADNLMQIVNDILDYSKIDAGRIEFEKVEFELRKLLTGIKHSFDYEVNRRSLKLEILIDENIPPVVQGDSTRLTQILINLVGNAVKFTEKGTITIEAKPISEHDGQIDIGFFIIDTGIGIPKDMIGMIFESFTQASSSTTRKYGGTGLGLAITQKLVEMQGGEIKVESKEGKGSTFSFSLPFVISDKTFVEDDAFQKTSFHSLKGLRVLVVEDNLVNQKIVSKYLSKWETQIDIADNGKIAVDMVAKNHYDVVLMDLHMPEMSGYEATLKIRAMKDDYYQDLPIIALTASVFLEDREKIFQFGMTGFITKPFNPKELFWTISPFLKKR
ncbi:MAG: response regulator [Bacteroidales bacterium]|nr:response regulator [Bacteroidales bacterium]